MSNPHKTKVTLTLSVQQLGFLHPDGPEFRWEELNRWTNLTPEQEANALRDAKALKQVYRHVRLEKTTTSYHTETTEVQVDL